MYEPVFDCHPNAFALVPDHYNKKEICVKAISMDIENLEFVPKQHKTKEMGKKFILAIRYIHSKIFLTKIR